jgi:hypothetical protein
MKNLHELAEKITFECQLKIYPLNIMEMGWVFKLRKWNKACYLMSQFLDYSKIHYSQRYKASIINDTNMKIVQISNIDFTRGISIFINSQCYWLEFEIILHQLWIKKKIGIMEKPTKVSKSICLNFINLM